MFEQTMEGRWLTRLAIAIIVKIMLFSIWHYALMKVEEKEEDKPLEDEERLFHILSTE